MKKGKLIVIEGIDGSGKSTQIKLLVKRLKRENKKIKTFHFPQHGKDVFGKLVDEYLNNVFGVASQVDYRLASLLYACDRFEAMPKIKKWLSQGYWVILDRYAESNFGHQGAKISSATKRLKVIEWLYNLDYKVFQNLKPSMVIFLDLPVKLAINFMLAARKKFDGHEQDHTFLINSRRAYLQACKKYDYWYSVQCFKSGKPLTIKEIHNNIYMLIKNKIIK